METTAIVPNPEFWNQDPTSSPAVVLNNPRAPLPQPTHLPNGTIAFATSGSSGEPKWILHTRASLLANAAGVNAFLSVTEADRWLCALPIFHVGGMGIHARAHLSDSTVTSLDGKWSPKNFVHALAQDRSTLTTLVPTQLHDLVLQKISAPSSLRAVIIGGGAMDESLKSQARQLGWPVLCTYGMTEAGSQVATEDATGALRLLPGWEARINLQGCLELKGPALAQVPTTLDGWFVTNDLARLGHGYLHWLGRVDRVVKILGELVNLDSVEQRLSSLAGEPVVVMALPDARRQHILMASESAASALADYHNSCPAFAKISGTFADRLIVRSPLGKVMRQATMRQVRQSL